MAEQSRTEEILRATIDGDEYTKTPQSREEELLIELKQTIEAGGGASVVPNPEGEATETLTKLGVNDTVYGIPKELPAVTSADAGDVLGVNSEGLWGKVTPSGGGDNIVIFDAEINTHIGDIYQLANNKKQSDIIQAFYDGKVVLIRFINTSAKRIICILFLSRDYGGTITASGIATVSFATQPSASDIRFYTCKLNSAASNELQLFYLTLG